ncbi:caspase domain protein [Leptospira ryugenii]|uniref:Caspase domain protein n=1 Tax=Leptospira ryugenii TaxID=1917863 RepID=A0A2P2E2F8_9LEPT|nr:caspase family protein [Leptospira ryugenii]GBF51061.1 caspase domain protein [Leptospira ryugenii]
MFVFHRSLLLALVCYLFSFSLSAQDRYGLFIGTNYKGNTAKIPELNLCEADANFLKEKMQKNGNFKEMKVLLGSMVTRDNVKNAIKQIGSKAGKNDSVFIYFSGHGMYMKDAKAKNGMRNYLICFDRPHISDEELNEFLSDIKSPKTVMVMDCCYSGGIAKKGKNTRGAAEVPIAQGNDGVVLQNADDYFFQDKAIISSSDDDQTSIEVGGSINHGIFTYNLGNSFEKADLNNDKVVTALEAFFVAKEETVKMAKKFNHEQTPQISGNAAGILLVGSPKPQEPPQPPANTVINQPVNVTPTPNNPTVVPVIPNNTDAVVVTTPTEEPQTVVENTSTVVIPPIVNVEPPAPPSITTGDLLIKTSIIKDKSYAGSTNKSPYDLLNKQGKLKSSIPEDQIRKIKVLVDGEEYVSVISTEKSSIWGATTRMGKLIPGEVYQIKIDKLPAGVHQIEVRADNYPVFKTAAAVIAKQTTTVDINESMDGFGAIQGRVFYKTLDNPIEKHQIYMPTIVSTNQITKVTTDKDGYFWFTNLKPGKYEIRASFMEDLKLENAEIIVKSGEVTKVEIILNKKMSYSKTKY